MIGGLILLAAVELVSPVGGEVYRLIPDCQRRVMALETLEERGALMKSVIKEQGRAAKKDKWRRSLPLALKWRVTAGESGPWEIRIGKNPDLSGARVLLQPPIRAEGGLLVCEVPNANLEIGVKYYWRISSNITCGKFAHGRTCDCTDRKPSVSSGIASFETEDLAPRWMTIDGHVSNIRDLGGRKGLDGKRVRQGLVYRGQGLNDNSIDGVIKGKNRLYVADVEYLTGDLGIRMDLDLRRDFEAAGLNGVSPLGKGVKFVQRRSMAYQHIFDEDGKKVMAANFREFCDKTNYPIYFHCIGGADRTGALAYVLNGVLGVSRRELETDWESTFYPEIPGTTTGAWADYWCREQYFAEGFSKFGKDDDSWTRRIELYLISCGVTESEIAAFRKIMLY